jgi:hypothetical protein
MQTWDVPFRIVRTRFKLLYFAGWAAVGVLLNRLFSPFVPDLVGVVVGHLLFLALVVVAVRSFRGSREPVERPRAWWRMTGTVRSGIVLAVVFLLGTALSLSEFLSPTHPLTPNHVVSLMIGDLENLVLAALYVNSAVRLRRSPDPIIPKPVTLAEPLNGLD